jgi:UDP-GlcNAc:undecaprenyl-phosphate/decaprenyl-phosphate GlcNAc-1-phosphate transferase
MTVYLSLLMGGVILSLMLTPLVRSASLALGLVDAPGGRKVHSGPVPRTGGSALLTAAMLSLAGVWLAQRSTGQTAVALAPLTPILIGAALIFAVGLFDDLRPLPVWPRVAIQVLAAAAVMSAGLLIERITVAGQTWELGGAAWLVTLVWIVGLTNAFNLIDGLDGLAAGIAAIAGATCAIILIWRGHDAEAMLLAALVGAALGFLVYNSAPASIFLGDGGSLTFGFVLATTAITGWQKGATALAAGVPLLIFALPIADAAAALVRRARRPIDGTRTPTAILRLLVQPDREHIHHRLTALGWSTRRTVLVLYGVTCLLSMIALATARVE